MSLFSNNALIGASAAGDYTIQKSLRFNSGDSPYLARTPSSAGNQRTWTYSCWFKITDNFGGHRGAFLKAGADGNNYFKINIASDDRIYVLETRSGVYKEYYKSDHQLYRDPTAWMHLVLRLDTTNSTDVEKIRVYINGTELSGGAAANPTLSQELYVNGTTQHEIGACTLDSQYFDGYIANPIFVDGLTLAPSSFAETNEDTGQWVPIAFEHSALNKENNNNNWSGNSTNLTNPGNAFNGDLASGTECYTSSGTAGNEGYFTLPTNITTSSLDVYIGTGVAGAEWWAEDTGGTKYTYSGGSNGWQAIPLGGTRTISKLGTKRNGSGSGSGHLGWRVDGEILITNYTTDENGFTLKLSDNSGTTAGTLGKDSSGNGNNFTPNNLSVTAGAGNDSLSDTPTNNFATLNPLDPDAGDMSNGNLDYNTGTAKDCKSTFGLSSGKWYAEFTCGGDGKGSWMGIVNDPNDRIDSTDGNTICVVSSTNAQYSPSSTAAVTTGGTWTTNDIIGIALDATSKTCDIYKNGSKIWGFTSFTVDGPYYFSFDRASSSGSSITHSVNFGQRAFSHQVSTYNALNTANLSEPAVKKATDNFSIVIYTGTGSDLAVTGVGFQADLVWIKNRSHGGNWHDVYDVIRGVTKRIFPNEDAAEQTQAQGLKAFSSDGWTVGNNSDVGSSGADYVGWNWKGGGSPSSNGHGTIPTSVSANATAGFSIISYSGTGSAGTIGHGLGAVPQAIITKRVTGTEDWKVYHKDIQGGYF